MQIQTFMLTYSHVDVRISCFALRCLRWLLCGVGRESWYSYAFDLLACVLCFDTQHLHGLGWSAGYSVVKVMGTLRDHFDFVDTVEEPVKVFAKYFSNVGCVDHFLAHTVEASGDIDAQVN